MHISGAPTIIISRPPPTGPFRPLTDAQIAADPIASEAIRWTKAYDGWLRLHGINGWDGRGGDISIQLDRAPYKTAMNYSLSSSFMRLAYRPDIAQRHSARSPEIVGHELTHGLIFHHTKLNRAVNETVSDVVGALFARSTGHRPALRDWVAADELGIRTGHRADGSRGRRDLAHPAIADVATLRATVGDAKTLAPELVHHAAGPVGLAATRMEAELGLTDVSRLWLDTVVTSLPAITGGSDHEDMERFARGEHIQTRGSKHATEADRIVASMSDVARGTLDSARSLWGADSVQVQFVRDVWLGVGVTPGRPDTGPTTPQPVRPTASASATG